MVDPLRFRSRQLPSRRLPLVALLVILFACGSESDTVFDPDPEEEQEEQEEEGDGEDGDEDEDEDEDEDDGPEPSWTVLAPLPERRTEVSATTDGRYVYLIGGFGAFQPGVGFQAPRTVWRYDPETDAWEDVAQLPEGVNHSHFEYVDGRLYILGGFRETSFNPVGTVRIHDLETGEWSEGAPMPTPRGAAGWTLLDGRIHVIGGTMDPTATVPPGAQVTADGSTNVHESYDPVTDTWSTHAPMPTPRNHLGAATLDGRVHAVLGRADGNFIMRIHEIYDPATNSWTTGPPVPTGRSGVAVVHHDGLMYAFGGERLDGANARTFDDAERYDPATARWDALPPMPTARHGLGAAALNGAIYVVSGGPGPGGTFGDRNERLELR